MPHLPGKIPNVRDVMPLTAAIRKFLLGRDAMNPLRFQQGMAERPGPEANLPEGPSHKLSGNYYYTRDARREMDHPVDLTEATQKLEDGSSALQTKVKSKTPGAVFHYSD